MRPEAYNRALRNKAADIKAGKFAIISFDVQEPQLRLLKDGMATALIGQRPLDDGRTIDDRAGRAVEERNRAAPVIDTGVDLVDAKNVDKFLTK